MSDMSVTKSQYDFSQLHGAMQDYIDRDLFAGISSAVLVGQDLVDVHCAGLADREDNIALRPDHIFRVFSNTKLITSIAVLMLMEEGFLKLDDPIERFIPQLGNRMVLKPGAGNVSETVAADRPITIRHLLSHSSGLSYGFLDPKNLLCQAYNDAGVQNADTSLATMIDVLEALPLAFQPGTSWEYSVATDVLGRLIEVVSGETLDVFFKHRIFEPLTMVDTGFWCPEKDQERLAGYYAGIDLFDPMKSGLKRVKTSPYPNAYLQRSPRLSGGGGLVSTLPDMIELIRSLMPGGKVLLSPDTLALLQTNQLPDGQNIHFPGLGDMKGRGFGLASSVAVKPYPHERKSATGEFGWGGIAGTQWWISPQNNLAGIVMTQRVMSFSHPFAATLKKEVYDAVVK